MPSTLSIVEISILANSPIFSDEGLRHSELMGPRLIKWLSDIIRGIHVFPLTTTLYATSDNFIGDITSSN